MDKSEAERRFQKADKLFTYGRFEDALADIEALEAEFPNNHRVLNAKARTLEQLDRFDQALAVCNRLVSELGYEKARSMRDRVADAVKQANVAPQEAFWSNKPAPAPAASPAPAIVPTADPAASESSPEATPRRFKVKPVRLLILIGLAVGMYLGYVPYWLGGGLIAAYFIIRYLLIGVIGKWVIFKLFTAPFKMKGKALAGATCQLHAFEWTEKPAGLESDAEDDEAAASAAPGRYVWLDVTITPPQATQGFTHWEPGELALAPMAMKYKGLDDLDDCFQIHDIKLIVDGQEQPDEGMKYHGPQRFKFLAELPHDQNHFKFVYYFEQFGDLKLSG